MNLARQQITEPQSSYAAAYPQCQAFVEIKHDPEATRGAFVRCGRRAGWRQFDGRVWRVLCETHAGPGLRAVSGFVTRAIGMEAAS